LFIQIKVGISVSCLFFVATAVVGVFDDSEWPEIFFWVNLAMGTALSAFCTIVQNMGMAMAGTLGEKYVRGNFQNKFKI
jgi:hypothetical protein